MALYDPSKVYTMTRELAQRVETVQRTAQEAAAYNIIEEYGEGPVKVVLELSFGESAHKNDKEGNQPTFVKVPGQASNSPFSFSSYLFLVPYV